MKFGVVVFPGSNCDRDMYDALTHDLGQEVTMLWHKDKDLSKFQYRRLYYFAGGFSYGDYLRCGAIARFSPMMQSVIEFANAGGKCLVFAMASRYYASLIYYQAHYYETVTSNLFAKIFLLLMIQKKYTNFRCAW
jgi:hypothetical protein